jgi:hypothetical protein
MYVPGIKSSSCGDGGFGRRTAQIKPAGKSFFRVQVSEM